jgi:hypothetical protein
MKLLKATMIALTLVAGLAGSTSGAEAAGRLRKAAKGTVELFAVGALLTRCALKGKRGIFCR